jgi:homoserine/homoserine lactone efflux protein
MAAYAAMAARLLSALRNPSHIRAMNRIFGSLFVLAGTLLALFKGAAH